jgi:secreted PhoX family phosphatase
LVAAATAREDANTAGATGYYRPEDMERDPGYDGSGLRACWTNTQDAVAKSYGEVMCIVDTQPTVVTAGVTANARIFRFWEGNTQANQPDNLAYQPTSNALFVIEDNPNGEIYACLPDGADLDERTDGCALIACVKDDSAEPTGWFFGAPNAKGEMDVYVSIQHSDDSNMPLEDGYPTDDLLRITGIKVKPPKN